MTHSTHHETTTISTTASKQATKRSNKKKQRLIKLPWLERHATSRTTISTDAALAAAIVGIGGFRRDAEHEIDKMDTVNPVHSSTRDAAPAPVRFDDSIRPRSHTPPNSSLKLVLAMVEGRLYIIGQRRQFTRLFAIEESWWVVSL
jgi:hypothetical protein